MSHKRENSTYKRNQRRRPTLSPAPEPHGRGTLGVLNSLRNPEIQLVWSGQSRGRDRRRARHSWPNKFSAGAQFPIGRPWCRRRRACCLASAGPLRRAIHWFGGGILSECKTENAPMTKAPAAVERNDDQGWLPRLPRSIFFNVDHNGYGSIFHRTKPSDVYARIKYPELRTRSQTDLQRDRSIQTTGQESGAK